MSVPRGVGPVVAPEQGLGQGPDPGGQAGQLGVGQPGRGVVPELVGALAGGGQAVAVEVAEPQLEVDGALGHQDESALEAAGLRLGVGRLGVGLPLRGLLLGPLGPVGGPLAGEVGRLGHVGDGAVTLDPQEQQGQPVLARELAGRAAALRRRSGEVHADLVRGLAAALALAPHERVGAAGLGPRTRSGQLQRRLDGRVVGRQLLHPRAASIEPRHQYRPAAAVV